MVMKKYLKILLVLLLCMIVFEACSDNKSDYSKSGQEINQNIPTGSGFITDSESDSDILHEGKETITNKIDNTDEDVSADSVSSGGRVISDEFASSTNSKQNTDDKTAYHCTILITCNTVFDNLDEFDQAKLELLPEDGIVFKAGNVEFFKGESAFDVLLRLTRHNRIHMEFTETPIYKSAYIEGINNIYEFDAGPLSGWMYKVNDKFPNCGSSRYKLEDGDAIEWIYTCDLGADIGGDWNAQNSDKGE